MGYEKISRKLEKPMVSREEREEDEARPGGQKLPLGPAF